MHYEKSMSYIENNDLERAVKELNKAIKHNSDMPEVYLSLSFCYYELGNKEMGLKYQTKWRKLGEKMGYDVLKLEGILPKL